MIYVILSVVLNAIAQLAMKFASQKELSVRQILGNIPLIYAAALYIVSILFWLKGLSGISLSRAYPYQSLGYILVFGLSYYFLNERFSFVQILGLIVICSGILILSLAK
jgi:multidrug transporter EmrE-like cation transporter